MPGHSALALMPYAARSRAAHWEKLMTAALAALYGGSVGDPIWPATDDRKQNEPRRWPRSCGTKACAACTHDIRLARSTASQSDGSIDQNGRPSLPDPTPTATTTWWHPPSSLT